MNTNPTSVTLSTGNLPPKVRLISGAVIFIIGVLSPVFIPLVVTSGLPEWLIALLSGLLAFGIPELFMIIAVAILGKEGFAFLRSKLGRFLKPLAPPDEVSKKRYNVGLVLFCIPLIFAFLSPYLNLKFHFFEDIPFYINLIGDIMFITSVFVLGGNFWDKLRALFIYGAKVVLPPVKPIIKTT
jgi:hypothetical protein